MRKWHELTSVEIDELIQAGFETALLPFGSIEQHGKHLCVSYDTLIAERLCEDIGITLEKSFLLPTIPFGLSDHHDEFKGTLTFSYKTIESLFDDLIASLEKNGLKSLIIINGHGGNYPFLKKYFEQKKTTLKVFHDAEEQYIFKAQLMDSNLPRSELGLHGGLYETSMALYTHPKMVRTEFMNYQNKYTEMHSIQDILSNGLKKYYAEGIIGEPKNSNIELGKAFYEYLTSFYLKELHDQK
jgi:creatinine amidohydrolase